MSQTELRQHYQSLVYTAVWKCPECLFFVHGDKIKGEYTGAKIEGEYTNGK